MFRDLNFEEKKKKLLEFFEILKETFPENEKDFEQYKIIVENYKDKEHDWIFIELYGMVQNMIQQSNTSKQNKIYEKIKALHTKEQNEEEEDPEFLLDELFMS